MTKSGMAPPENMVETATVNDLIKRIDEAMAIADRLGHGNVAVRLSEARDRAIDIREGRPGY